MIQNNPKCYYCRGAGAVCSYCVDLRIFAKETTTELVAARAENARLTERLDAATGFRFGAYDVCIDDSGMCSVVQVIHCANGDDAYQYADGGKPLTREEAIALAKKLAQEERK